MYFTSESCAKTKLLPVIAVPITNDVSNADLPVGEVIKLRIGKGRHGGSSKDTRLSEQRGMDDSHNKERETMHPAWPL